MEEVLWLSNGRAFLGRQKWGIGALEEQRWGVAVGL